MDHGRGSTALIIVIIELDSARDDHLIWFDDAFSYVDNCLEMLRVELIV